MSAATRRGTRVLLTWFLLGVVSARPARAEEPGEHRVVVVLRPSPVSGQAWPEGTQAVVAELVAGGYELTLRASSARDRAELLGELERVVAKGSTLGAVVVVRKGDRGVAFVHTRLGGTVPVETGVSEGAVGAGALSLRITQLLGPPILDVTKESAPSEPPDAPPAPPAPRERRADFPWLVALTAGFVFSSDLPEPLPIVGVAGRRRLAGPLSLDATGALALGDSRLETAAGSVDVSTGELTLHLSFDPLRRREVTFSLGLGGGLVWLGAIGRAESGYSARSDTARVALLSARAAVFFSYDVWSLILRLEPGMMLPAATVVAARESARIGRPWTNAAVGLGWNF